MIAVIDYGINKTSDLLECLSKIGEDYIVTNKEPDIINCDHVIIGDASNLSKAIRRIHLMNLFSLLRFLKKPTLGISMGMELLCNKSNDGISCLGLIESDIINDTINDAVIRLPGMKSVEITKQNDLFAKIENGTEFYFANNYHVDIFDETIATAGESNSFSAAVQHGNFYGVQFIPEKSGEQGLQILKNFCQNII